MACVAIVALFGCKPDDQPANSVAVTPVEVDEEVSEARADETPPAEPATAAADDETTDQEAPSKADLEEATAGEPSAPSRDLAGELAAALGSPVDCVQDYRPSTPTTVRIGITAIVRPSGVVIEPSASGTGLSYNDRKCIEERVGSVVLEPFGAQASQSVSTSVDLKLGSEPPAVEEQDVGGPAPKLTDVVEPLPKKKTIPPSGVPIQKAPSDKIEGPKGVPIEGPQGVPVEGPKPTPIEGYQVDEGAERWRK